MKAPALLSLALALATACAASSAQEDIGSKSFYQMSEAWIDHTLQQIHDQPLNLQDRIAVVSSYFLGTPYKDGPLGEGPTGEFNRNPLISFQEVDCTTLVEEVMALSLESNLQDATAILQKIRYKNGEISYQTRNHFPEADWIANNIAAGFIKDITREIAGDQTKIASKRISKRDWYAHKSLSDIQGFNDMSDSEKADLLKKLQTMGENFPDETVPVSYLPIELLPNYADKIPSGAIANLIRADNPKKIVLISHQVLIINKNGAKYVRHAALNDKVIDVPLQAYFQKYANSKWPLLGLNFDQILPQ